MIAECANVEMLAAYAEHELEPEEILVIEAHLADCSVCRQIVILTVRSKVLMEDLTFRDPADS